MKTTFQKLIGFLVIVTGIVVLASLPPHNSLRGANSSSALAAEAGPNNLSSTMRDAQIAADFRSAIKDKNARAVQSLIKREPKDKLYPYAGTFLHIAADEGSIPTIDDLIRAGNNINAADSNGVTAFGLACETRDQAFLSQLVSRGARAWPPAVSSSESALQTAVSAGNAAVIPYLISLGVDPNYADSISKMRPLMLALVYRCQACIPLLLKHGADPAQRDGDGKTPKEACRTIAPTMCPLLP